MFSLDKISGLSCEPGCWFLRRDDDSGRLEHFYKSKGYDFNLPEGNYLVSDEGMISGFTEPILFKNHLLPRGIFPPRFDVSKTEILLEKNPNIATVRYDENLIRFDPDFWHECTYTQRSFILFHELGHSIYNDESLCDMFAENMMLKSGFNPSQIIESNISLFAPIDGLFDRFLSSYKRQKKWTSN